jgi:outer membrane receptor protein involved in Fe transport
MPAAKELLFDTGYRYSSYKSNSATTNIGFKSNTYKFEVQYAPIQDVRLRLSYDKAIRAPSIIELYNPQLVGMIQSGNDPCAPPVTFTQAQCANLGVSAAQYAASVAGAAVNGVNPIPQCVAGQCSQLQGGNPALKPEQAETYTVGVNFQPSFLPKFSASLDYFHISIKDEVTFCPRRTSYPAAPAPAISALQCGCSQPADRRPPEPTSPPEVTSSKRTSTWVECWPASGCRWPRAGPHAPAFGAPLQMNGSWLQHSITTPVPGGGSYDCAGLFGFTCQTVNPRWHHNFRTTWNTPWDVSASLTWRYLSAVNQDANTGNPLLANPNYNFDVYNARIPSFSFLDLEATWHPTKILTIRAGAATSSTKDPPLLVSQAGLVAAYREHRRAYDIFGRQLFVAFTAKF